MNKIKLYLYVEEVVSTKNLLENMFKTYLPAILTIVVIIIGLCQFKKELNRKMYEKRLSQVYAPLIGVIAKQEFFREWEEVDIPFEDAQILELLLEKKTVTTKNGKVKELTETYALIDRNKFTKIVSDIDLGFANPKLIKTIKEFELILDIQNNTKNGSELYMAASKRQGKAELVLLKEIINGYSNTIKELGLDKYSDADCLSFPHITETIKENY